MALVLAGAARHRPRASAAALPAATLLFYLTAVHTVFQAEPRYATAYRGIEILLILTLLQELVAGLRRRRHPHTASPWQDHDAVRH